MKPAPRVLITGATGFIGTQLVQWLSDRQPGWHLVATDVRPSPAVAEMADRFERLDVRDQSALCALLQEERIDTLVHLASIVVPPPGMGRDTQYEIDVVGTRCVLEAAVMAGVEQIVATTSGAAYGYHADNPEWLSESDPLRGNDSFAYSAHKRLVEELLAEYRQQQPQLRQLVLRPGTVLGATASNQITNLFEQRCIIGVAGCLSPFVFIWDQDLVQIIARGVEQRRAGIYNVAGDGALTMAQLAARLGKPYLPLPAWFIRGALSVLKPLGLNQYGPEQVKFISYRPVLDNRRLKAEFGYVPQYTSEQAFDAYLAARESRQEVA
ncbi:NAD-dependent epimerase/dehydratase family protein [Aestuariirhabdus litorea]|uniref:NAD-dependent epimerase/dehydratase family protein n=2 Tax=Aestuariirhabdus litorea TaxID=2528527 RepID=A0A3P3VL47_9GAMM|nr:NAD-dependent epimerase/dehydratase family protein [Aestuariirhabdus litorea]RWW93713.1 NAD-dependent epimerase/dehydratase family protein [Endozoicomonadaceae bacterium GTF-13]